MQHTHIHVVKIFHLRAYIRFAAIDRIKQIVLNKNNSQIQKKK